MTAKKKNRKQKSFRNLISFLNGLPLKQAFHCNLFTSIAVAVNAIVVTIFFNLTF